MEAYEILERLLADNPKLHHVSKEDAEVIRDLGQSCQAGPASLAVPPEVLRYLGKIVQRDHLTLETGGGHTTVALAALAKHHTCVMYPNAISHGLITRYLAELGVPPERITFILESSDTALPRLALAEKLDFAFIDGCHGYPFPALDWHFIDLHLKVGGIVGLDNTEIRSVHNHCAFLEENAAYCLTERISNTSHGEDYGANFYRKLKDEDREWLCQSYNRRAVQKSHPVVARIKNRVRRLFGS